MLRTWQLTTLWQLSHLFKVLPSVVWISKTCSNNLPASSLQIVLSIAAKGILLKQVPLGLKPHFLNWSKCRRPDWTPRSYIICPLYHDSQISSPAVLPFSASASPTSTSDLRVFLLAVHSPLNAFPLDSCSSNSLTAFKQLLKCCLLSCTLCLLDKHSWMPNKHVKLNMFNMRTSLNILFRISISTS